MGPEILIPMFAASNVLSNIFGAAESEKEQKQSFENSLKLMAKQNEYNVQNWHMQNEYNLPVNQMKRFADAGLNPNLIYSQTNTAGDVGHVNPTVYPTDHTKSQAMRDSLDIGKALSLANLYQDMDFKQAQTDNVIANKKWTDAKTQTEINNHAIQMIDTQIRRMEKQGKFADTQMKLDLLRYKDKLLQAQVDLAVGNAKYAIAHGNLEGKNLENYDDNLSFERWKAKEDLKVAQKNAKTNARNASTNFLNAKTNARNASTAESAEARQQDAFSFSKKKALIDFKFQLQKQLHDWNVQDYKFAVDNAEQKWLYDEYFSKGKNWRGALLKHLLQKGVKHSGGVNIKGIGVTSSTEF